MTVRRINLAKDYPEISKWWVKRHSEAPPEPILAAAIGIISEMEGIPVACAFLYEAKRGAVAFLEWEATNPAFTPLATVRALDQIFDFFETYCRDNAIRVVFSWVAEGRGDGRLLERRKWIKCPGERHELMAFSTQPQEAPCP